jgi:hypothetical protein
VFVAACFHQRHPDTVKQSANDLAARRSRIDDSSDIVNADRAFHSHLSERSTWTSTKIAPND